MAYVFEDEEEVLEMADPEKWNAVKRILEQENNFTWLSNEMVSYVPFSQIFGLKIFLIF